MDLFFKPLIGESEIDQRINKSSKVDQPLPDQLSRFSDQPIRSRFSMHI